MSDTMNQADEQTIAVTREYESASSQILSENNTSHEKTKQMATAEIPSILANKSRTSVVARTQHLLAIHKRKRKFSGNRPKDASQHATKEATEELEWKKRQRELLLDDPPVHKYPARNALDDLSIGRGGDESYHEALKWLRKDSSMAGKPSQSVISGLEASRESVPTFLFRAYSLEGTKHTKGYSSTSVYQPAADKHLEQDCHATIYDMSVGEFKYMLGNHLLWKDYNADEVLSWTNSLLFAFEHALGRHRKHQSGCYIAMVDTRRATTVTTRTSTAGRSVSFFNAPALWKAYEVLGWSGWGNHDRTGLHPRKFTHEFLSHGVIKYEDATSRRLPLVDLVDKGLFRIYPEFEIFDKSRKSTGLYERCVALRRALFPELKKGMRGLELIPLEHLDWAVKIARCFVKNETPEQEVKAPLILVLKILSLRRRPSRSRLLVDWIREHYNRQDLEDIIHPDMTRVADNLPENLQYLDLVRDSCYALDVPMIPDNIVERACHISRRLDTIRETSTVTSLEFTSTPSGLEMKPLAD
ncbi:hypothetical protein B0A49_06738 [Cryomyces minteri]|uniref:DUF7587 domain-containing protein n=1 Tax=Cryomyces minteri TaxID=331657 RepID=A0A4U0WXJ6_9PEZI|nr:hypothetical protein B0A49_06738 [Cryomyces minteri]